MDNKPPQYPERAHLERDGARHARPSDVRVSARGHLHQSPSSASASALQTELSAAMSQPLLSPSDLQAVGSSSAGAHSPGSPRTALEPASYEAPSSISRPASLALPNRGRRDTSTRPLLRDRQRSLSFNSMEDALAGDPFAWLRQTVQEQREQEKEKDSSDTKTVSLPASPIEGMPASLGGGAPASMHAESPSKPQDYFGWMSLIAGKGTVKEHVSEETVRRDSLESSKSDAASAPAASASRFSLPTLPSMPAWQAPSFPKFQAPSLSMPKLQLQAPSLQLPAFGTSSSTPGARRQSTKAGEDPAAKYMDEEDRTASDEPDWSRIKDKYEKPRLPMVFLHGLFGFSVIGPSNVPALQIQYWRGVREALEELGVEVLMTSSPASGNVETRAKAICEQIAQAFPGREVNLIGHSMGGLDSRYLITHLQPTQFTVKSCTTIATPHRGSPFADFLLDDVLGRRNLPSLLAFMSAIQMPGGGRAFDALTTAKMADFNESTPDDPAIQYYSYGAQFRPSFVDPFRLPWSVVFEKEGENDGLVSVESCQWGDYIATLENVNHLDLVGWVGPVRFAFAEFTGKSIKFKPVSFYLAIAEMLAQRGY